jgi:RNA polymerase-binding transcription factor DksA
MRSFRLPKESSMTIDQTDVPTPDRAALDAQMIIDVKRALEEQRREHHRILNDLPPPHVDPVAHQQAHTARTAMAQIDAALHRLVEGTYGLCIACQEQIPPARLEARPHTERCVPCQEIANR